MDFHNPISLQDFAGRRPGVPQPDRFLLTYSSPDNFNKCGATDRNSIGSLQSFFPVKYGATRHLSRSIPPASRSETWAGNRDATLKRIHAGPTMKHLRIGQVFYSPERLFEASLKRNEFVIGVKNGISQSTNISNNSCRWLLGRRLLWTSKRYQYDISCQR